MGTLVYTKALNDRITRKLWHLKIQPNSYATALVY